MVDLRKAAAIVGVHEHPVRYAPDKSEALIMAESIIGALEDAGLHKQDVDALFSAGAVTGMNLVDYLNMEPKWVDFTNVGGGSFEFHLSHAATAIAAGRINCAVITYAATPRVIGTSIGTGGARAGRVLTEPLPGAFEELYGTTTVGLYAMIARRHMHQYGTTSA
ncbi:MAG: thiolase domain-containing protein, partial [Chloroflexi bacterium]|nr:thiolase domain-containing protein [Chloroflexota bacterium]